MKRAFAVSSAAHVAFLILVMVPGFHRAQIPATRVINVKLDGEEKPEAKKAPKVETPAPRVEPEKEPDKPKMTYKPKTKTRKTEAPKAETKPKEEPKKEPEKTPEKPAVSGAAAGGKSSVRVDDENFKFAYYLEIVRETISYNWSPPPVSGYGEGVMTTVYFKIARDGGVSGVRVEEKSSFDLFDRSAVRAVNVSSPLPPLPAGFGGRWLGVHFEFEQTSG